MNKGAERKRKKEKEKRKKKKEKIKEKNKIKKNDATKHSIENLDLSWARDNPQQNIEAVWSGKTFPED